MQLGEIEKLTRLFAEARKKLEEGKNALEDEIQSLKRSRRTGLLKLIHKAVEMELCLKSALEDSRELFIKPRTMIFHGVKIGFQKAKGKISWADDAQVVRLIKKHLPEQADILIKTTEKPIKDALLNLSAADLKRIGVTVDETGDQVVIKATDSEIDKFMASLLKEQKDDINEEAA